MEANTVRTIACQSQKSPLLERQRFPWKLSYMTLKHEVYAYTHQHEEKAIKLWKKDKVRAKKTIVHAIREILFAMQIIDHGKVIDFSAGNDFHAEIMDTKYERWTEMKEWYQTRWDGLLDQFSLIVNRYKEFVPGEDDAPHLPPFIRWLSGDLSQLDLLTCIQCTPTQQDQMEFHAVPPSAPVRSQAVKEARGIVLHPSSWNIQAFPLVKFFNYDEDLYSEEKFVPSLDWTSLRVTQKMIGVDVTLYHHGGSWQYSIHCGNHIHMRQICEQNKTSVIHLTENLGQAFMNLWQGKGYLFPQEETLSHSFVYNAISEHLYYISSRDATLQGEVYLEPSQYGWQTPPHHQEASTWLNKEASQIIQQLELEAKQLNPLLAEGWVVQDRSGTRIKIRSPMFRVIEDLDDDFHSLSLKNLQKGFLSLVRCAFHWNNIDEWRRHFPMWVPWLDYVYNILNKFCTEVDAIMATIKDIADDKQFAIRVPRGAQGMVCFQLRKLNLSRTSEYLTHPIVQNDARMTNNVYAMLFENK
eukprot:TRINITY_DN7000_c0_g1_i1.p1 TRINITY_DN7000_c0_g1~~TRINITY_DN7000_c0_g1_i1.p1  ORF type:complete len:590 (-),score=82.88 TRINITY_DN7000_c0_g1_i1:8-1585(-)